MLGLQWILAVAYSPDGKTLASSGSSDGTIQLWKVENGTLIRTLNAISADAKTVASADKHGNIFILDWKTLAKKQK